MATEDLYSLVTLDTIFRSQKVPAPNVYLPFFGRQINFDTDVIMFDKVAGDDRYLAPFALPTTLGRPLRLSGYETRSFRPAYIKMLDPVTPQMHVERVVGEGLGGTLSLDQRRQLVKAEILRQHRIRVNNRFEWLAARAIIDGQVVISGEDYPSTLVDFRRNANLSVQLTGGARWTENTADPLADIKDVRKEANGLSGATITKLIFGGNAYDLFSQRVDLKEMMNKNFGGQSTQVTLISDGFEGGIEYMGSISGLSGQGRIELWVDTTKFVDGETGVESYFLDQDTVVGVSQAVAGVRCFGAIMDQAAGFRATDYFFKNYYSDNPSAEYLLSQSAPLMVPKNPDATFKIKVTNGS